jgi:alpha-ketoglutarate-dependent taurine dioxygenase
METTAVLRPIEESFAGEVLGVDLSRDMTDAVSGWVERAFAAHPVHVFRNQELQAAHVAAFGRRFGTPRPHALLRYRHPEIDDVSYITNVDANGKVDPFGVVRATTWHTDATYEPELPRLTMLYALEVPSKKGGTMFADMRAAYDALPEATQERLAKLTALHGYASGPAGSYYKGQLTKEQENKYPERRWPAVVVHPYSGRKILFVNPMHVHGFAGMPQEEAWSLVSSLAAHAVEDRFVYYHQWRVGDVVMWDDMATMHRGAGDSAPEERRIMMRTIVYPETAQAA